MFQLFVAEQNKRIQAVLQQGKLGYQNSGTVTEDKYGTMTTRYSYLYPNKVKIEVDLPNGDVYQEGYNGRDAWEMDKYLDETQNQALVALRHGAEWPNALKSLQDFRERGNSFEYIGKETIKGVECYKTKVILADGFIRTYWIEIKTGNLSFAQDNRPLHPTEKTRILQTRFEDYQNIEGLEIAMTVIDSDLETKEDLMIVKWKNVKIVSQDHSINFDKIAN